MLDIISGLTRGAARRVLTGKHGNKNFYKGKKNIYLLTSTFIHHIGITRLN